MVRTYCDKCEKEIIRGELGGTLQYLERKLELSNDTAKGTPIQQVNKILCEKCLERVLKVIK